MLSMNLNVMPDGVDFNGCILDRVSLFIRDGAFDPGVDLLDVGEQRLPIVVPVGREVLVLGILEAPDLQGDLEVIGVDVVPILHPATHTVPLGSIGDTWSGWRKDKRNAM